METTSLFGRPESTPEPLRVFHAPTQPGSPVVPLSVRLTWDTCRGHSSLQGETGRPRTMTLTNAASVTARVQNGKVTDDIDPALATGPG
jgi:hypothetical protein